MMNTMRQIKPMRRIKETLNNRSPLEGEPVKQGRSPQLNWWGVIVQTFLKQKCLRLASTAILGGGLIAAVAADAPRLEQALAAQPEEIQARYPWRHPAETLTFFGIEPGMTVVEVLPGGGWYSSILTRYLGPDGVLIGADYAPDMWAHFPFGTPEFIEKRRRWGDEWVARWGGKGKAALRAGQIGHLPDELDGSADAVLFIRALHNLSRFERQGGFLSKALADAYAILKPGGIVGVVQHWAPPEHPPASVTGARGYMNRDDVIAKLGVAGFELAGSADFNANPADKPGVDDIVWRLPPNLRTSKDKPELRAKYQAIGETNRMTLLFRKPE